MFDFFLLPSFLSVFAGCILIAVQSAAIGTFTVLRREALAGDAIAHAVLPGICIAYILTDDKSPFVLLIGAALCGWLTISLIGLLHKKTRIKHDAAIGITLSVFFGLGLLLLSFIQHSNSGNQSGLDSFLLGKAAGMLPEDLITVSISCFTTLLLLSICKKEIVAILFDANFSKTAGIQTLLINSILSSLLIITIITGIQFVGIILMASLLITPIAIARFWSNSISPILGISLSVGIVSASIGVILSTLFPTFPTGATIVLVATSIFGFSAIFAPQKGIISRVYKQYIHSRKTAEDNILKLCYHSLETTIDIRKNIPDSIQLPLDIHTLNSSIPSYSQHIKRLIKQGFLSIDKSQSTLSITRDGLLKGIKITRLHRLWEAYLMHALKLDADHVHDDAESIEHILTPELELELERILVFPEKDPHGEVIPPSFSV